MSRSASPRASASAKTRNPVLCASALARLLWAFGALLLLWTTVFWALH
jgi:cell division septal protein FtsQ